MGEETEASVLESGCEDKVSTPRTAQPTNRHFRVAAGRGGRQEGIAVVGKDGGKGGGREVRRGREGRREGGREGGS